MAYIILVLFLLPFLQVGPFDNWLSFLAWAFLIVIPLIVCILIFIFDADAHENNNSSKKN